MINLTVRFKHPTSSPFLFWRPRLASMLSLTPVISISLSTFPVFSAFLPRWTTTLAGLLLFHLYFDQSAHYFVPVIVQNAHCTFWVLHLNEGETLSKLDFDDLPTPFKQCSDVRFFVVIWEVSHIERVNHTTPKFFTQVVYFGIGKSLDCLYFILKGFLLRFERFSKSAVIDCYFVNSC